MKKAFFILSICFLVTYATQAQVSKNTDPAVNVEVKVYPNPATSFINFDFKGILQPGMKLEIFHMLGRKMQEVTTLTEKTTLQLNDYTRGLYVYHLVNSKGQIVKNGKFNVSK